MGICASAETGGEEMDMNGTSVVLFNADSIKNDLIDLTSNNLVATGKGKAAGVLLARPAKAGTVNSYYFKITESKEFDILIGATIVVDEDESTHSYSTKQGYSLYLKNGKIKENKIFTKF